MSRAPKALPPERLLALFERGFSALWRRAHRTLGDVTLTAIVDRVLLVASERFPFFTSVTIETKGLHYQELRDRTAHLEHDQLVEGIRFVLVEFLTVLGNLTADVLTPALHAELLKIAPVERGQDEKVSRPELRKKRSDGEDGEP